jgi:hypothetical protein
MIKGSLVGCLDCVYASFKVILATWQYVGCMWQQIGWNEIKEICVDLV